MRKILFLFISCLFISLNMQAQIVSGVELDSDTIFLPVSCDTTLIVHVKPWNAIDKDVMWKIVQGSSLITNTTIALDVFASDTICKVTASASNIGEAKIEVTSNNNNLRKDTTVIQVVIPANSISLDDDTIRMYIEGDTTLTATLTAPPPHVTVTADSVIWEIYEGASVVEIESTGHNCNITALALGTAKIVAKTYDYDGDKALFESRTDTCVVEVSYLPIESLTLNEHLIEMTIGEDSVLYAQLSPRLRIDRSVAWITATPAELSFIDFLPPPTDTDTVCRFKAKWVGTARIVAKSGQDPLVTDTCTIVVRGIPADTMFLNYDTLRLNVGVSTSILRAKFDPINTTNDSIEWISQDSSIVNILSSLSTRNDTICVLDPLCSDTAKIYARSFDGNFKDTCVVIVYTPVDSVVFQIDDISVADTVRGLQISDTIRLKATVYPDTATIRSVTWSIGDLSIIDTTFVLRDTVCDIIGLKKGEVKIYATVNDRGLIRRDSCVFTVDYKPIDSIRLHLDDTVRIIRNAEEELIASVYPFLATNDSVIWTSSDATIVEILPVASGHEYDTIRYIKALALDTAKIYVTSKFDPTKKDSCVFIVLPIPADSISIPTDSMDLYISHRFTLVANTFPWNATEKSLSWTSSNSTIVEILSSTDTICEILGRNLGMAKIYAITPDGLAKDSIVVTVKKQFVYMEADTVNVNGGIELYLALPSGGTFQGTFTLQLPKGFGLTKGDATQYRTTLLGNFKETLDLEITWVNDSTYLFSILPKTSTSAGTGTDTKTKVMEIVYTIYDNSLKDSKENYFAKIVDVNFELGNNSKIEESQLVVIKSFMDPTGNESIGESKNAAYIHNHRLYVNTDKAETVSVYSLNGSLLFMGEKKEGAAVFNLNTTEKALIVRGSSGWAEKVANL